MGSILQEMFEDAMVEKKELLESIEEDGSDKSGIAARIAVLDRFLDEDAEEVKDDLVDEWEAALARGEMPDLEEGLN